MTTRTVIEVFAPTIMIAFGLLTVAARRWDAKVRDIASRLADSSPVRVDPYREREIEKLPTPVQRYFRAVLVDGQAVITHARHVERHVQYGQAARQRVETEQASFESTETVSRQRNHQGVR